LIVRASALCALALLQACEGPREARQPRTEAPSIQTRGREVVAALKSRDGARLARLVHPDKGVRFSPYSFVRAGHDLVLTRDRLAQVFRDTTSLTWGTADGSGETLTFPFEQYYRRFVYDVDFAAAPVVRYNQPPARMGNTPNNIAQAYPGAQWVEFHYPRIDAKYQGMDWRSLWLVFERQGDEWLLIGIVHGSWTI
jgi:hypothetical protein